MRPTETLVHEHQIILLAIGAAEREVSHIEATGQMHEDRVEQMLDLFPNFADRCHHAKEEKLLFVRMGERGMPAQGGPIAVMLQEHEMGRGFLRAAREAVPGAKSGDAGAIAQVRGRAGRVRPAAAGAHRTRRTMSYSRWRTDYSAPKTSASWRRRSTRWKPRRLGWGFTTGTTRWRTTWQRQCSFRNKRPQGARLQDGGHKGPGYSSSAMATSWCGLRRTMRPSRVSMSPCF